MQMFEYKISIVNRNGLQEKLDVMGVDGWELIAVNTINYDITLYLKRPFSKKTATKEVVKKVEDVESEAKMKASLQAGAAERKGIWGRKKK